MSEEQQDTAAQRPVLRVVHGSPTAEELAALVTVLVTSAAGPGGNGPGRTPDAWTDRARVIGAPPAPGPGAWRASALPR